MEKKFQSSDFNPDYWWKVKITATCPKCDADMDLEVAEDDVAIVVCPSCRFRRIHKDVRARDVAKAVIGWVQSDMEDRPQVYPLEGQQSKVDCRP